MSYWLYWELIHAVLQAFDIVILMKDQKNQKIKLWKNLFQEIKGIK